MPIIGFAQISTDGIQRMVSGRSCIHPLIVSVHIQFCYNLNTYEILHNCLFWDVFSSASCFKVVDDVTVKNRLNIIKCKHNAI